MSCSMEISGNGTCPISTRCDPTGRGVYTPVIEDLAEAVSKVNFTSVGIKLRHKSDTGTIVQYAIPLLVRNNFLTK